MSTLTYTRHPIWQEFEIDRMGDPFIVDQKTTTEDVLFTRADGEIQKQAWRLNGEAWAAPLSIDDYVNREIHLSKQSLSKDGGCTYWVLAHKADPTHIVASCESIQKTLFIAGKDAGVDDGFREAKAYAVASVYTNPKYRRLGMAAYMLRKLQDQLDDDSECSALYSDLGKIYYASLGWEPFPSDQATIYLQTDNFALPETPRIKFLTLDDLPALCDKDVAALKAKFRTLSSDRSRTHIAFSPDYSQISWQLAREQFVAKAMFSRKIERRGAITVTGQSWVYWEHDWREKKLNIMRFVTLDRDASDNGMSVEEEKTWDLIELLRAAAAEAVAWGLTKVLIWNPDLLTTAAIKGFHNFHEEQANVMFDERPDSSVPSLRWKGGRSTRETVWEDNYYYCWC